jgi:hypothetical protein
MMSAKRGVARAIAVLVVLAAWGCEATDRIAPDGSSIVLTANPATILLENGVQSEPVDILASVKNSIGVPLPGQDLRFTTSSGVLDPPALTRVTTDKDGQATVVLTEARQAPTVTASSGKTSAMLTLQTATCPLATITLSPSTLDIGACTDTFTLTAEAIDTSGEPCQGILITFAAVPTSTPSTDVTMVINPASKTTDTNGIATSALSLSNSSCTNLCEGTSKTCTGQIQASSGNVKSSPVSVSDTF